MLLSFYPIFGSFGKPVSRRSVFSVLLLEDDFDLLPLDEVFLLLEDLPLPLDDGAFQSNAPHTALICAVVKPLSRIACTISSFL